MGRSLAKLLIFSGVVLTIGMQGKKNIPNAYLRYVPYFIGFGYLGYEGMHFYNYTDELAFMKIKCTEV